MALTPLAKSPMVLTRYQMAMKASHFIRKYAGARSGVAAFTQSDGGRIINYCLADDLADLMGCQFWRLRDTPFLVA